MNLFAKTWTKGHWPLDDLWPHICWGHMCDSTHGSLCPSPMGIHQCMWIQWSILQKLPHTYTYYIHTHTTYYVQNQWSHSLFLNYVQARQKLRSLNFLSGFRARSSFHDTFCTLGIEMSQHFQGPFGPLVLTFSGPSPNFEGNWPVGMSYFNPAYNRGGGVLNFGLDGGVPPGPRNPNPCLE